MAEVNHPAYYSSGGIEAIDFIDSHNKEGVSEEI